MSSKLNVFEVRSHAPFYVTVVNRIIYNIVSIMSMCSLIHPNDIACIVGLFVLFVRFLVTY